MRIRETKSWGTTLELTSVWELVFGLLVFCQNGLRGIDIRKGRLTTKIGKDGLGGGHQHSFFIFKDFKNTHIQVDYGAVERLVRYNFLKRARTQEEVYVFTTNKFTHGIWYFAQKVFDVVRNRRLTVNKRAKALEG